jgi:hypothetical protein
MKKPALPPVSLPGGRDASNFLITTLGTGIGRGLVLDGRVIRGAQGFAGQVGHFCVQLEGLAFVCGWRGCFEQYAWASAIPRFYQAKPAKRGFPVDRALTRKECWPRPRPAGCPWRGSSGCGLCGRKSPISPCRCSLRAYGWSPPSRATMRGCSKRPRCRTPAPANSERVSSGRYRVEPFQAEVVCAKVIDSSMRH